MGNREKTVKSGGEKRTPPEYLENRRIKWESLREGASKELAEGKIRFRREFLFPQLTFLEIRMLWIFISIGSVAAIILIQLPFVFIGLHQDILSFILPGIFCIILIVSVSHPIMMYFGRLQMSIDKKWALLILTDRYLILTNMDAPGLGLSEIVSNEKDRNRFIMLYKIENILQIKPHWLEFKTGLWRKRDDIRMLAVRRHVEYSESIINADLYIPRDVVLSFLSMIQARNPIVIIDKRLGS